MSIMILIDCERFALARENAARSAAPMRQRILIARGVFCVVVMGRTPSGAGGRVRAIAVGVFGSDLRVGRVLVWVEELASEGGRFHADWQLRARWNNSPTFPDGFHQEDLQSAC